MLNDAIDQYVAVPPVLLAGKKKQYIDSIPGIICIGYSPSPGKSAGLHCKFAVMEIIQQ
jgi:hypothetical protein